MSWAVIPEQKVVSSRSPFTEFFGVSVGIDGDIGVIGSTYGGNRNWDQMEVFTLTKTTISLYFNLIVKTFI